MLHPRLELGAGLLLPAAPAARPHVRDRAIMPARSTARGSFFPPRGPRPPWFTAAVPHGFRSSFRDWAVERTNTLREVVEAALAHTVRNPTEAAYARSDLFERRRRLMDDWAVYLDGAHGQVWHDDGNRASP